ncbi:MAG: ABC transporter substrate-binding protein [Candidatus Poribacteria bacterium]|nr:MAG: ABC transporter substrate-binding protein [Candidatus Poribacteria bacterium]
MRARYGLLGLLLGLLLVGGALESCRRSEPSRPESGATVPAAYDATGAAFPLTGAPRRLVSISPNCTEILFALGVGDRVVGVTTNCDYPEAARAIEKVGDFHLNYEKILSLRPDLVVGSESFHQEAKRVLESRGLRVFLVADRSIDGLFASIEQLGKLLEASEAAVRLRERYEQVRAQVAERIPYRRLRVLWVQYHQPLSTVGPGNFHHDLIQLAGGENVAADLSTGYGPISEEVVLERDPEVVLTLGEELREWVQERFPTVTAVRAGRVYVFNDAAALRPGPRLIEAIQSLHRLLYPEP